MARKKTRTPPRNIENDIRKSEKKKNLDEIQNNANNNKFWLSGVNKNIKAVFSRFYVYVLKNKAKAEIKRNS